MCQYGLLSIVLKYRSIWIFLISVFMGQILIANENVERLAVENKLRVYLQSIDQKDVNDISEHFYFDGKENGIEDLFSALEKAPLGNLVTRMS